MAQFINDINSKIIFVNQILNGADLIFTYHDDQRPVTVGIAMLGDDSIMNHGSTGELSYSGAKHDYGQDENYQGCKEPDNTFDKFKLTNKIVMSRNLDDENPLWCEVATIDDVPPPTVIVHSEMINTEINHYTEIRNETIRTEFNMIWH